jgi:hypothetical protein
VRYTYLIGLLVVFISGCTVYHGGVKDVTMLKDGGMALEKCDLTVYLAFYGLVTSEDNCRTETKVATRIN